MNPLPDSYRFGRKLERFPEWSLAARFSILVLFLAAGWGANAQQVSWSGTFVGGSPPTAAQCSDWSRFLNELGQKSFFSVTLTGTFDAVGKSITDHVAANQLATLLHSRTAGRVTSGPNTWIVSTCGAGACDGPSIALSVISSNSEAAGCVCTERYAVRPQSTISNWGGVNSATCFGPSQTMSLVFGSGVAIAADGPTTFCSGGSVVLTANTQICSAPYAYLWSNGKTDQSITVTEPGNYSVTVTGSDGCSGTSAPLAVQVSQISVAAGEDVVICKESVQLNAVGSSENQSGPSVNKVCIFDANGGNCAFTSNLCADEYATVVDNSYSQSVTISNPESLKFHLYYSPNSTNTTFLFKINGQQIGSYLETKATRTCTPVGSGQYPRSFTFLESQFKQYWNAGSSNTLTVEVDSDMGGVYLAGIMAEVTSASEFYSWSPAEGLSDASIMNPFASPETSTVYTVTYTDASGCTATDQVAVNVKCNTAPVAVCREVSVELEGNCEAMVEAASFDGGSTTASGGALAFSVSPAGPYPVGTTEVLLTVTDINGESSTCATTVTVIDAVLPEIVTPDDLTVPNDPGECFATLTLAEPQTSDNCGVKTISNDHEGNAFSEGETVVTWTVTDIHGNQKSTTQKVTVINTVPVIDGVDASASFVVVNSPITLTIAYTDDNVSNASLDWGDGSAPETVTDPANVFQVSHTYVNSGSYSVTMSITDACGANTYAYESVMVINDRKGSASGGGWYASGPGAYLTDPRAAGKATFAFEVSNENRNQTKGHVVFNFKEAKIKFRSTRFEWVSLEEEKAIMKAFGRLNGIDDYQILISVLADDNKDNSDTESNAGGKQQNIDYVRVKIWNPAGAVIYDTQWGSPDDATATTPLGGGSMKVDLEKTSLKTKFESPVASSYGGESSSAYPNPFRDWVDVQFNSASSENVVIQVLDLSGKVIFNQVFPASEDGRYPLDIQEDKDEKGIYILIIKQGKKVEFHRLVRE